MNMREDQAAKKICPQSLAGAGSVTRLCMASRCMAWSWTVWDYDDQGVQGQPTAGRCGLISDRT